MKMNKPKISLIMAVPRSGTTFVSRAMDHAPETIATIGNLILPVTCSIYSLAESNGDNIITHALSQGLRSELERRSLISSRSDALYRLIDGRQSIGSTLRIIFRRGRHKNFVFKEPFLSFSPNLARSAFPNAKIFWIIRDGRDVANSLVKSYNVLTDDDLKSCVSNENPFRSRPHASGLYIPWWVPDHLSDQFISCGQFARAALMWAVMMEKCHDSFKNDNLVTRVTYESLVSHPELTISEICKFLEVSPSQQLKKFCYTASPKSIGSFQKRSPKEIDECINLIGDTLLKFGYQ